MARPPSSPGAGTPSTPSSRVSDLLQRGHAARRAGDLEHARDAFEHALGVDPDNVEGLEGLGTVFALRKDWSRAKSCLHRAVFLRPDDASLLCSLAGMAGSAGTFDEAVSLYRRALQLEPTSGRAFEGLAWALPMAGCDDQMPQMVARWLEHHPTDAVARHLAASLGQRPAPDRCEDAYIETFFDGFAPSYDELLVEDLKYRVPELVQQRLQQWLGEPVRSLRVLDAGCGTGLCGPILRPWAADLHGVDLSPGMLERARQRSTYDALHRAELTQWLDASAEDWDLVVAADVLVYFGDLTRVLQAAGRALRPGGRMMFSVERSEAGEAFALSHKGRYVHGEAALQAWLTQAGLQILELSAVDLRMDRGTPEGGWLVVAGR